MLTVNFRVHIGVNNYDYSIPITEYKIYRRNKRVRYEYLNGGVESHYRGFNLLLNLKWESLNQSEQVSLFEVINSIRRPDAEVEILNITGDYIYLGEFWDDAPFPLYVDLEDDEVIESMGKWMEKTNYEITFIIKKEMGPYHNICIPL